MPRRQLVAVAMVVVLTGAGSLFLTLQRGDEKPKAATPGREPPGDQQVLKHESALGQRSDATASSLPSKNSPSDSGAFHDLSDIVTPPEVKLPQWEQAVTLTQAVVQELPEPDEPVTIDYRPALETPYSYVTTSITKIGMGEMRTLEAYGLCFKRGEGGDLLIAVARQPAWIMADNSVVPQIANAQVQQMVIRDGAMYKAREQNGKTVLAGSDPLGEGQRESVWYDIPPDTPLHVGTAWKTKDGDRTEVTHRVAGYADVQGIRTVRLVSERDDRDALRGLLGKSTDMTQLNKCTMKTTTYVSVDSGMVVRQEGEMALVIAGKTSTTTSVTQLVKTSSKDNG